MEKRTLFRIFGLVMALVMLFALSGCGDDDESGDSAVNANVTEANEGTYVEASNSDYDLHPTRNIDGSYTYHNICGQDWTISFRVEDLVKDGVIDNTELNKQIGFADGGPRYYDSQGNVIAKTFAYAGLNSYGFSHINLTGRLNENEGVLIYLYWDGGPINKVQVLADGDYFPVALEQLVVAIYGCQYYMDEQIKPNPYEEKLKDYLHTHYNDYNIEYYLH
ncbi:hypothetical protein IJJ54_02365 [Candidatus Saccharibacteria bacterium]|nr:hypothetical protein [Candidatus Saccharibacteria bacterium]